MKSWFHISCQKPYIHPIHIIHPIYIYHTPYSDMKNRVTFLTYQCQLSSLIWYDWNNEITNFLNFGKLYSWHWTKNSDSSLTMLVILWRFLHSGTVFTFNIRNPINKLSQEWLNELNLMMLWRKEVSIKFQNCKES